MRPRTTIEITDRQVCVRSRAPASTDLAYARLPRFSAELDLDELADAVASTEALHGRPRACELLLPASWCYVHAVPGTGRRPTRPGLAYAFEEFLPLPIEALTCDFLPGPPGCRWGVALETQRAAALLRLLEARGAWIERISLSPLAYFESTARELHGLWCDELHVACVVQRAGRVTHLRVGRLAEGLDDAAWVARAAAYAGRAVSEPGVWQLHGRAPDGRLDALAETLGTTRVGDASAKAGRRFRFDLARGPLLPARHKLDRLRCLRRAAAGTLMAILLLAAGETAQLRQLRQRDAALDTHERGVFQELFPNEPVPTGVVLRLSSERRRIETRVGNAALAPDAEDALYTLREFVACIPPDQRLDLQELAVTPTEITLRARTTDHRQAELLARAIAGLPGWSCPAPRTERNSDGSIQMALQARPADPPARSAP